MYQVGESEGEPSSGVSFLLPALLQWTWGSSDAAGRWRELLRGSRGAMWALVKHVRQLLQALTALRGEGVGRGVAVWRASAVKRMLHVVKRSMH